jgi:hypothetical protein
MKLEQVEVEEVEEVELFELVELVERAEQVEALQGRVEGFGRLLGASFPQVPVWAFSEKPCCLISPVGDEELGPVFP